MALIYFCRYRPVLKLHLILDLKQPRLPGEGAGKSGKGGCSLSEAHSEGCDERLS